MILYRVLHYSWYFAPGKFCSPNNFFSAICADQHPLNTIIKVNNSLSVPCCYIDIIINGFIILRNLSSL